MGSAANEATKETPAGTQGTVCARCGDFVNLTTGVRLYDGRDYCGACLAASGAPGLREWVLANPEPDVKGRRPTSEECVRIFWRVARLFLIAAGAVAASCAFLVMKRISGSLAVTFLAVVGFMVGLSFLAGLLGAAISYFLGPGQRVLVIQHGKLRIPLLFGSFSGYDLRELQSIRLGEPLGADGRASPVAFHVLIFQGCRWYSVAQSVRLPVLCEGMDCIQAALHLIAEANAVARGQLPSGAGGRG